MHSKESGNDDGHRMSNGSSYKESQRSRSVFKKRIGRIEIRAGQISPYVIIDWTHLCAERNEPIRVKLPASEASRTKVKWHSLLLSFIRIS